jgi:hypothetical protein
VEEKNKMTRNQLKERDQQVLLAHNTNPLATNQQLANQLNMGYYEIRSALNRLGVVRKNGPPKKVKGN